MLSLTVISLACCSGPIRGGGGGGAGNATVSFTLVADTLPANPSILSFHVSLASITLTPTSGTAQTLTVASPVIDLMRLQSDAAFLGTLTMVPAGTYTVQVALSNPEITFLNDTSSAITAGSASCSSGAVCAVSFSASATPVIGSFTFTVNSMGQQGIGIDFNLKNAISLSGGTLSITFNPSSPSPAVLSAFALPRQNSDLGTNQLDLIEDFTGVVAISGSTVTLTSPTRGTLTATATSNTILDADPSNTLCTNPTPGQVSSCTSNNQVASVDALLNSNGTLSIQEIEPLLPSQQDVVEGIVVSINAGSQTQFNIVINDKPSAAAANSLIGAPKVGDLLTVSIPSPNPFLVDTKGLPVANSFASIFNLFNGQTNTSAIHLGQNIALHVTAFTAANGSTPASVTADTLILRWSRFTATPVSPSTTQNLNTTALPSYFNLASGSQFVVQLFPGTKGTKGVTNFDGIPDGSSVISTKPVSLRAIFFENTANSATPAFFAAKVRQQ